MASTKGRLNRQYFVSGQFFSRVETVEAKTRIGQSGGTAMSRRFLFRHHP